MAGVLFTLGGSVLALLMAANMLVVFFKMTRHERLAARIIAMSSNITWLFKLGGEDRTRLVDGANGRLRA